MIFFEFISVKHEIEQRLLAPLFSFKRRIIHDFNGKIGKCCTKEHIVILVVGQII